MDDDLTFNIVRSNKRVKERLPAALRESRKSWWPGLQAHACSENKAEASEPTAAPKRDTDVSMVQLLKEIPQRVPFRGKPTKKTFSVALPVSLVPNILTDELRAYIIGSIARALTIYGIHEVILYNDMGEEGLEWQEYFAVNLRFLETPQYLRKYMFPISPDLRNAGLQNPLDAPHHLRSSEWLPYREGVIKLEIKGTERSGPREMLAECGLFGRIKVSNPEALEAIYGVQWYCLEDTEEEVYQRVTLLLDSASLHECRRRWKEQKAGTGSTPGAALSGRLVAPDEPQSTAGLYWGYVVREAEEYAGVFRGCPFTEDGSYDYKIGTSERGSVYPKEVRVPDFRHLLMVIGPVNGLESVKEDPKEDVDAYVNFCYNQRSRTIRTEEALTISDVLETVQEARDLVVELPTDAPVVLLRNRRRVRQQGLEDAPPEVAVGLLVRLEFPLRRFRGQLLVPREQRRQVALADHHPVYLRFERVHLLVGRKRSFVRYAQRPRRPEEQLRALGPEVYRPLRDEALPRGVDVVVLGGGNAAVSRFRLGNELRLALAEQTGNHVHTRPLVVGPARRDRLGVVEHPPVHLPPAPPGFELLEVAAQKHLLALQGGGELPRVEVLRDGALVDRRLVLAELELLGRRVVGAGQLEDAVGDAVDGDRVGVGGLLELVELDAHGVDGLLQPQELHVAHDHVLGLGVAAVLDPVEELDGAVEGDDRHDDEEDDRQDAPHTPVELRHVRAPGEVAILVDDLAVVVRLVHGQRLPPVHRLVQLALQPVASAVGALAAAAVVRLAVVDGVEAADGARLEAGVAQGVQRHVLRRRRVRRRGKAVRRRQLAAGALPVAAGSLPAAAGLLAGALLELFVLDAVLGRAYVLLRKGHAADLLGAPRQEEHDEPEVGDELAALLALDEVGRDQVVAHGLREPDLEHALVLEGADVEGEGGKAYGGFVLRRLGLPLAGADQDVEAVGLVGPEGEGLALFLDARPAGEVPAALDDVALDFVADVAHDGGALELGGDLVDDLADVVTGVAHPHLAQRGLAAGPRGGQHVGGVPGDGGAVVDGVGHHTDVAVDVAPDGDLHQVAIRYAGAVLEGREVVTELVDGDTRGECDALLDLPRYKATVSAPTLRPFSFLLYILAVSAKSMSSPILQSAFTATPKRPLRQQRSPLTHPS
ncbi:RNA methyltransferase, putative [Babesia caballi]|uniref:RNA methyltransferase, putative n=1 Tax=Babesia caballi TaxID=5871 RepID=A0AAV4M277_BABCB|nr:RNA methyltransferase, putative [Babesia caballi]